MLTIKLGQLTLLLQPLISHSESHLKLQVGFSAEGKEQT